MNFGEKGRKTAKKIFALGMCLCVLIIACTACGRREIAYNTEEMGTGDEGNTSEKSQNGIPEHIEDSLTSGTGEITVNADVLNIESYGKLPVAIMKIKDWSEQDIKDYAEAVFDKGSAEVVLPIEKWSREKLLDEEAEVQTEIEDLGYTTETIYDSPDYGYLGDKLLMIRYCIENYNEENEHEDDAAYKWISTELDVGEEGTSERLTCQVKGTIGGKVYGMYVQKWGYEQSCSLMIFPEKGNYYAEKTLTGYQIEAERVAPDAPVGADNICSITEQEAVQQAEAFVSQLGIQGFAVSDVYQARCYNADSVQETRGYLVYFGRAMGGCSTPCVQSYLQTQCIDVKEEHIDGGTQLTAVGESYGYEGITIWITDDGVEEFLYLNPMEVSEIATEQTEVIDFEQAYKSAMKYMQEKGYDYEIDKIKLCMGRVKYEDSYALVPVWCYEYDISYSDITSYREAVLVNAIDGSIIDIGSGKPVEQ